MPIMQIACGGYHSIVLTMFGSLYAFGQNTYYQLGVQDSSLTNQFPILIESLKYNLIIRLKK